MKHQEFPHQISSWQPQMCPCVYAYIVRQEAMVCRRLRTLSFKGLPLPCASKFSTSCSGWFMTAEFLNRALRKWRLICTNQGRTYCHHSMGAFRLPFWFQPSLQFCFHIYFNLRSLYLGIQRYDVFDVPWPCSQANSAKRFLVFTRILKQEKQTKKTHHISHLSW